jgi:hypothetical protein
VGQLRGYVREFTVEQATKFWAAMRALGLSGEDPVIGTGYIHRRTWDVILLTDRSANYQVGGEDLLVGVLEDRRKYDASPDDWIEIPKFDPARDGEPTRENLKWFARQFLEAHALV